MTMSSDFAVSLCGPDERLEFCVGWLWILDFAVSSSFCNDCSGFCPSARKQQKIRNTEFRIQSLSPTGFWILDSGSAHSSLGLQVWDWALDFGFWILPRGFAAWLRSRLAHPQRRMQHSLARRWAAQPHQLVRIVMSCSFSAASGERP